MQICSNCTLMKRVLLLSWLFWFLLTYIAVGQDYTMSSGTVNITCSGTHNFYDPGGPNGNYGNNINVTQTFIAPEGQCLQVTFVSFDVQQATTLFNTTTVNDYLEIYDGTNTSSSLIGQFYGANSPGHLVSASGALTFKFHSNQSVRKAGWEATISCAECPSISEDCNPQSTDIGSPCAANVIQPFCTENNDFNVAYPSVTGHFDASSFLGSSNYDCLRTTPRPSWFYLQIDDPGDLLIHITQYSAVLPNGQPNTASTPIDIDFVCWGPFDASSQEDFISNLCCGFYPLRTSSGTSCNVVDCSYSAEGVEDCLISNAQQGKWYLLMVCNYTGTENNSYNYYGSPGYFGFSSLPMTGSGQATTNCGLLAPISYNNPVCEGDTLTLTCENPMDGVTYHWSGPNGWEDSTQVPTVSIPDVTTAFSGQFSLQITGASQNVNVSHVEVTVKPTPTVSISANPNRDTICSGTQVVLTASGAGTSALNYHWKPDNSTGRVKSVTLTTTVDTSYVFTVTGTLNGCTGTASDTIAVFPNPAVAVTVVPENAAICKDDTAVLYASGGESYVWRRNNNATTISTDDSLVVTPSANTTYRVIATSAAGCTSEAVQLVTVYSLPLFSIEGDDHVCLGDSVLLTASSNNPGDTYLWSTGEFTRSIWVVPTETTECGLKVTNTDGCSSSEIKEVTLFTAKKTLYRDTICWNETYQDENFDTQGTLMPGNYSDSVLYQTVALCDSMVFLELWVWPMQYVSSYDTACDYFQWREKTYWQSGVYCDSVIDNRGCLKVDTLHLVINDSVATVDSVVACEKYTWIDGQTYTMSTNTPTHTLMTSHWCDSVVTLHLTVYHTTHELIEKDTCSFYSWHDNVYTATGLYQHSGVDEHGCPYTDTLMLTVHHPSPASMSAHSCDVYQWNDSIYSETGVYTYGHSDTNTCWQVDTLFLSITPPVHLSSTATACDSYEWHGRSYTQSGTYYDGQIDTNGCMQVDTLYLTVYHPVHHVEHVIVCEPYTWHGFQHEVSGTHTFGYDDEHQCHCVDTLYLTVTTKPELVLAKVMDASCNHDNGYIKIDASGGLPPYRYVYLPDGEEAHFEGLAVGNYHLQMIDSIGCSDDKVFHIDNIIHQVELVSVTDARCGRADGSVRIAASGGFGEFSYYWPSPIVSSTNVADHVPAGLYSVAVKDSNGCSLSLTFRVKDIPGPDACFTFSTSNEQQVTFVNCTQQGVTSWFWSFGDGQTSTEWQPSHIYDVIGEFPVVLTVEDDHQCVDSLSLLYVIKEVPGMYLPSAFIPESNIAENRVFKPYGNSISASDYEMTVYDRWGRLVFVSHHPDDGWDGRVNGSLAPQGTYVYQILYRDLEGRPDSVRGSVLLLR